MVHAIVMFVSSVLGTRKTNLHCSVMITAILISYSSMHLCMALNNINTWSYLTTKNHYL